MDVTDDGAGQTSARRGAAARALNWVCCLALAGSGLGCGAAPIDVATPRPPDPLLTGLVGLWPLDDGSGATAAADHSGNKRPGSLTGGAWVAGKFGDALHFESGDAVSVSAFPDASASWSVALWARPASATTALYTLVSTELVFMGGWEINVRLDPPPNTYYEFGYWVGPGQGRPIDIQAQSDYTVIRCMCVDLGVWTHVAAVLDGAGGTLSFYVNGVQQPVMPMIQPTMPALPPILPGSPTLYMGRWSSMNPPRLYVGDLDDVAIYDRALTATEVARLFASPVPEPAM